MGVDVSGIVNLPKLETLKGSLLVYNNLGLSALWAASLSQIDGQLIVKNAQSLSVLAIPKLSQVADLVLDSLPRLSELGIDIQNATNIFIGSNRMLGNITLHVKAIHENITITNNGNELQGIFLPDLAVVDKDFTAGCNSQLADLTLPSLEHVGNSMRIQGNLTTISLHTPEMQSVEGGLWLNGSFDTA